MNNNDTRIAGLVVMVVGTAAAFLGLGPIGYSLAAFGLALVSFDLGRERWRKHRERRAYRQWQTHHQTVLYADDDIGVEAELGDEDYAELPGETEDISYKFDPEPLRATGGEVQALERLAEIVDTRYPSHSAWLTDIAGWFAHDAATVVDLAAANGLVKTQGGGGT